MRNIVLILLLVCGFFACQDDDGVKFDIPVEFRKVEFQPVSGGALMKYYVQNPEVYGVRVRYHDAWGELRTRDGSYLSDTLLLSGFTEERQDVSAQISFFNSAMVESDPVEMTFNTKKSATVALFDSLKVQEFWGGFSVGYTAPELVSGMLHIFYLGTNPMTGKPDSILVSSTPIKEGGDTLNFEMTQVMDKTDVIVRTDDFDGKRVKLQVYKDMPCLSMDTLKPGDFKFEFTGTVTKNLTYAIGEEYLFDGDKVGIGYRRNRNNGENYRYNTFVVGPYAFYKENEKQKNRFIIDLGEKKVPALVSLYAFLNYQTFWPQEGPGISVTFPEFLVNIWNGSYYSRLPAKVRLYGTNEDPKTVDLNTCTLLYKLDDEVDGVKESWATRTDSRPGEGTAGWKEDWMQGDEKDVLAADPVVLRMLCNYTGAEFQYLILVVLDTYSDTGNIYTSNVNPREYVTFNEMEVCVKAE